MTNVLLSRLPLTQKMQAPSLFVQLACLRHAASVQPEPGSNSQIYDSSKLEHLSVDLWIIFCLLEFLLCPKAFQMPHHFQRCDETRRCNHINVKTIFSLRCLVVLLLQLSMCVAILQQALKPVKALGEAKKES